jgi:hypothetical protein
MGQKPPFPATSPFCRWIEELARRGVVSGCGGGNYCPSSPVTREQMGVFIAVTFALKHSSTLPPPAGPEARLGDLVF